MSRTRDAARGKIVVLCASAIESVRILLNSECERHPSGVGGATGHLGRYVCDHVTCIQGGIVPDSDVDPEAKKDNYDYGGGGLYIPGVHDEQRGFSGRYGVQVMIGRGSANWAMFAQGEMQPRYENRVTLDAKIKDAWGIPAARIECSHSENDIKMAMHMTQMLPRIALAGGLGLARKRGSILYRSLRPLVFMKYGALRPGGAVHEMGGARMGDKPENSVLNSFCQCWDADNVFVTDAACFLYPGFQNPTLTSMALTSRACQFIVDEYWKRVR